MADDFNATGGTSDTGLAYNLAAGYGGGVGAFDFGEGGEGGQGFSATVGSAVGDASNEDVLLSVPSFANDENRALNERLIARNRELAKASAETLEHQERISVMQEHLKNVRLELANAQKVLIARDKEVKSENHLNAMAERSVGRMKLDLDTLERRVGDADQQLARVQSAVVSGTEKLEAFKQAMNWKQEELEKWSSAARAKEDDSLALEKYTRADEQVVKDRVRELERMSTDVITKRKELEQEALDAAAKQVELDALADAFKSAQGERASLLDAWQESLRVIEARDGDIRALAEKFADIRLRAAARREKLEEGERLLTRLENENKDMDREIATTNRSVSSVRDGMLALTSQVGQLRDRVDVVQYEVQGAAGELLNKRREVDNGQSGVEEKRAAVARAQAQLAAVKATRDDVTAQAGAVERALAGKEKFLAAEYEKVERAEKDVAGMRESQFRAQETVAKLVEQEGTLRGEITGAKRTRKNLEARLTELDAQAAKQAEHLYSAEFQVQQMERKIGRAKGEVSEEERVRLEARIAELKGELEEVAATERQLSEETKSVKQALQAGVRRQAALTKQLVEVQGGIDEALLQTRSGEEALKKATRGKEEALVSNDLLKLQVRRLRDALSSKTVEVYTAENRAAQLALSIEARKKEIGAHMAVQKAQKKLGEEERHRLAVDLGERAAHVALLRTKYESLCARMRGGEDEGGAPKSQAYYVLKAAQKREELQREGDELDTLIRRAEKEVKALASTLGYLSDRNEVLRRAFAQAGEGTDEVATVRALEAEAKGAQDALYRKKRELASMNAAITEASGVEEEAAGRVAHLQAQITHLDGQRQRAVAEREAQRRAVSDQAAQVAAARERHRSRRARGGRAAPSSGPTPDELAFHAVGIREASSSALYTMGQLARELPDIKADLSALLAEANLRMPVRPPSQAAATGAVTAGATSTSQGNWTGVSASPIALPTQQRPGSPAVAGSALAAIRARPGSAQSAKSGRSVGSASVSTGRAGGVRVGTPGGKTAEHRVKPAAAAPGGLQLGLTGKPLGGLAKPPTRS